MAGFATTDNPQITVFITIDEPSNGAYYAGVVTAPLGKVLLEDIFNYMNEEFSEDENVILKDVVLPELRGSSVADAKKVLKDLNIECTVEGDGDNSLGIETTIQGDGVVINQSIPSGELISEGTVVKITLSAEYEED